MTTSSTDAFSLESAAYNVTQMALEGMFPPLKGYDGVITRVFDVLLRKEKTRNFYNPLLINKDTTLTWHIVLEVIRRLATGDAPDPLPSLQVIAPNFTVLCCASPAVELQDTRGDATADVGRWAHLFSWPSPDTWGPTDVVLSRLQTFFFARHWEADKVLFLLHDFHRLIGGDPQPYVIDLAPLLVPLLARREMQLLGTSSLVQYRSVIERDASIQRRVQAIVLRSDEEIQYMRRS